MIDVVKRVYKAIVDPTMKETRSSMAMYPSSASVVANGVPHGSCLREGYYRWMQCVRDNRPADADMVLTAMQGEAQHIMLVGFLKSMVVDTQLVVLSAEQRFYDSDRLISGRSDIVLQDVSTGEMVGCDIKTVSDYAAGEACTQPRIKDLLQCALYLDQYDKATPKGGRKLTSWVLLYIARGHHYKLDKFPHGSLMKHMWQYSITLGEDGHIIVENQLGAVVHHHDITIDGIYERYDELLEHIRLKQLPPRDYTFRYDEDRLTAMYKAKEGLTKPLRATIKDWLDAGAPAGKLGIDMGDFECRWCSYSSTCYSATPEQFEVQQPTLHSIKEGKGLIIPTTPKTTISLKEIF